MPLPLLAFSLLILLMTPGPTNTLMALAGAEKGMARARRLIPAELLAYLAVTVPLAVAGAQILQAFPPARSVVALAAAAWVFWLALRMWRLPEPGLEVPGVTFGRVFVTTLLNPKALVIGLVLLPADTALLPRLAVFCALVVLCALVWVRLGAFATGAAGCPPMLRRAAACWLALLSAGLVAGLMHA